MFKNLISVVQNDVKRALLEDVGTGDVSAQILPIDLQLKAQILTREPMVVAGILWAEQTFFAVSHDLKLVWLVKDGQEITANTALVEIRGSARAILTAERTALNFLQTLSGVATKTKQYFDRIAHTTARLLDTRKTLPGLRVAQKYAVRCGGGMNHRLGLFDAYLLKENHIRALGSITKAVTFIKTQNKSLLLEVEVETLDELKDALAVKPDRIMLDNFSLSMIKEAVMLNNPKVCDLEISGGINLNNIAAIAKTGVDWISVGDLTKSVNAIDLTLLVQETW